MQDKREKRIGFSKKQNEKKKGKKKMEKKDFREFSQNGELENGVAEMTPQKEEEKEGKSVGEALAEELYALKRSVESLKANNNMLKELISVNFEQRDINPSDALLKKLMKENEDYKRLAVQRIKDIVYNKVKEEYPDVSYNCFEEFPEEFHRLVCARVSPATAYKVVSSKKSGGKLENMGKVASDGEGEKEFYSSKEVDKLSKKQLSNPKVMENVLKSMLKW